MRRGSMIIKPHLDFGDHTFFYDTRAHFCSFVMPPHMKAIWIFLIDLMILEGVVRTKNRYRCIDCSIYLIRKILPGRVRN